MAEQDARERANVLLGEAVMLRSQGKRKEALAKCQESLRIASDNAEAFDIMGDLYVEQGRFEAAVEAYKRVLELDPSRAPTVEIKLARSALRQQKFTDQRRMMQDIAAGRVKRPGKRSPGKAGLLSLIIPGWGQLYNEEIIKAVIILVVWLFVFGKSLSVGVWRMAHPAGGQVDPTNLISGLFSAPAVWWSLLAIAICAYAAIDATMMALRKVTEEEKLF
jgi:tetratricopeptide (TPR) repeat protein